MSTISPVELQTRRLRMPAPSANRDYTDHNLHDDHTSSRDGTHGRGDGGDGGAGGNRRDTEAPATAIDAVPDGGYGWTVVSACAAITFMINGWSGSWGVLQTALLQESPHQSSTGTLPFVGSMDVALSVGLGILAVRVSQMIGARSSMLIGALLMSGGSLLGSFTLDNLAGLFVTAGLCRGLGSGLAYTTGSTLPVQWFDQRLGTTNGLVKLGGGLGATITALYVQALIGRVGVAWAVRIFGLISLATGVPAAWLIKERGASRRTVFVDWSLFKDAAFCCLFFAGAVATFALYVPTFFLPLVAHSLGLSPSTGAGVLAAYNACATIGRLISGVCCDRFGATTLTLAIMTVNAISMLAIWPVSDSIVPLVAFAAVNGVANGAFYVTMPTAISRLVGPERAQVAVGMTLSVWFPGCFLGTPFAGMLIGATGAASKHAIDAYRPAIFYCGGVSATSAILVLSGRILMDRKWLQKI